jgi:hypothetical protein
MVEKELRKLIKKDKYQVFLFSSPASFPFNFFLHCWFVISEKGKISRYELLHFINLKDKKRIGHLYINFSSPDRGLEIFPLFYKYFWKARMISSIEGNNKSMAKKMASFIKKAGKTYPYCYKYDLVFGPNSNTFVQWIINKFPETKFKLSWRAIGKNYNIS